MTFAERIEKKFKERGIDSRILSVVSPMADDDHNGGRQFNELVNMAQWIGAAKHFNIETSVLSEIVNGNETKVLVARQCPDHIFNAMLLVKN